MIEASAGRALPVAVALATALVGGAALVACGESGVGPPITVETPMTLNASNLAALDEATQGTYEAWVIGSDGAIRSAGRFTVSGPTSQSVSLTSPISNPTDVMITIEPPGDADGQPSMLKVMGGRVEDGRATLDTNRYLTAGVPLEDTPGTHVLFTPSDNLELGYPSFEDSGIWLFNIDPDTGVADTLNPEFYLTFTPLTAGWIYEGWLVYDYGSATEVWLSYGKFEPDNGRKARFRDSSGVGPFSGQIDYVEALPREVFFPGDDWVANPFGYPVPGDLPIPVDLNGCEPAFEFCPNEEYVGVSRFTHVVTVEPWEDRDEDPWLAEPFVVRPYRNSIGEGGAHVPRVVALMTDELPGGSVTLSGT